MFECLNASVHSNQDSETKVLWLKWLLLSVAKIAFDIKCQTQQFHITQSEEQQGAA